jgi:hypothetical protein
MPGFLPDGTRPGRLAEGFRAHQGNHGGGWHFLRITPAGTGLLLFKRELLRHRIYQITSVTPGWRPIAREEEVGIRGQELADQTALGSSILSVFQVGNIFTC